MLTNLMEIIYMVALVAACVLMALPQKD